MIKYSASVINYLKSSLKNYFFYKVFFAFFDHVILGFFLIYSMSEFTEFKSKNKEYFLKGFIVLDADTVSFLSVGASFLKNFSSGVVLFPSNDVNYFSKVCELVYKQSTGLKLVGFIFEGCYVTLNFNANFVFTQINSFSIFFNSFFYKSLGFSFVKFLRIYLFICANFSNIDYLVFFKCFLKSTVL